MNIRPLTTILTDLLPVFRPLADQFDLQQELEMADRALQRDNESLAYRAIQMLVLSAHASGLTQRPEVQHAPAYSEAVKVLRMSGGHLPADL